MENINFFILSDDDYLLENSLDTMNEDIPITNGYVLIIS